jgi:hypothetical protein
MDVAAFAADLPRRFGGDVLADHPVDRRFATVVDRVPGMSTEHALTVLDLAVEHLGQDECYLEVGSYRGRSLVGAMMSHPERRAIAVESFDEFGVDPVASRREVGRTLRDFGCEDRVEFVVGDAFRLVRRGFVRQPVGAYFYDGAHGHHGSEHSEDEPDEHEDVRCRGPGVDQQAETGATDDQQSTESRDAGQGAEHRERSAFRRLFHVAHPVSDLHRPEPRTGSGIRRGQEGSLARHAGVAAVSRSV